MYSDIRQLWRRFYFYFFLNSLFKTVFLKFPLLAPSVAYISLFVSHWKSTDGCQSHQSEPTALIK